ncbi:MAG: universal stress protein [Raoultibacter sp.]|jgi:nucleotide-binding universal stress UspA family protein
MPYHKILVAYDRSGHSKNALDSALELLEYGLAESIVVLYATETYISSDPALEAAGLMAGNAVVQDAEREFMQVRQEVAKLCFGFEDRVETLIRTGNPKNEILEVSEELGCGLIVMGSRGIGAIQGVLGSVSYATLRDSKVPVLVIK